MAWKCGDCGKLYSTKQLVGLKKTQAVETDDNPKRQHGFVSVCSCGYRFFLDKWKLQESKHIEINWFQTFKILISTVDLELDHLGNFYETMIFPQDTKWKCDFQTRYKTKPEAREGHRRILMIIKNKEFTLDKKNKKIIIT